MPDLSLIPVPLYDPLHPYHWHFDNLPLQTLKTRDEAINDAVNINSQYIREAFGTQGSLAGRLAPSLNDDGTLTYSFVESVKATYPYYLIRLLGGLLYFSGMVIMAWNVWKTAAGHRPVQAAIPPVRTAVHTG